MTEIFKQPLHSHLVTFNPYKTAVVKGYIEKVSGMLLSQYLDSEGSVITNRTILTRDEMIPDTDIKDYDSDNYDGIHFFKTFPNLTMDDVARTIHSTLGKRFLFESFDDLIKLGCIVPKSDEDLIFTIADCKDEYSLYNKDFFSIGLPKEWIVSSLRRLYSMQSFLKRRIVLKSSDCNPINEDVLNTMNQLLENQYKYRVYYNGIRDEDAACNDGVNTYYKNGVTTAMTREEFISKYPDAYEELG